MAANGFRWRDEIATMINNMNATTATMMKSFPSVSAVNALSRECRPRPARDGQCCLDPEISRRFVEPDEAACTFGDRPRWPARRRARATYSSTVGANSETACLMLPLPGVAFDRRSRRRPRGTPSRDY
jgi:hypothetical protein